MEKTKKKIFTTKEDKICINAVFFCFRWKWTVCVCVSVLTIILQNTAGDKQISCTLCEYSTSNQIQLHYWGKFVSCENIMIQT